MSVNNDSASSSDEEILPDIFESNQKDDLAKSHISKGDIIWAEFRNIHWPALVRNVNKKDRKIILWYLDSPGKCFKVPITKVRNFKDTEVREKSMKAVENTPEKHKYESVFYKTLSYLQRKAEGKLDDPAKFFDVNAYYLALSNSHCNVNSNKDIEKSEPSKMSKFENEESNADDNSDEDSLPDEDIDQQVEQRLSEQHTSEMNLSDSVEDEALVNDIVLCIKSGLTDSYLLQIRQKKIKSEYQTSYDNEVKSNNRRVFRKINYGPVKSMAKLNEIASYLLDLFEKSVCGGKTEIVDYIASVWVPESITKAVSLLNEDATQGKKFAKRNACKKKLFNPSVTGESKRRKKNIVTKGNLEKKKQKFAEKLNTMKRKKNGHSDILDIEKQLINTKQSIVNDEETKVCDMSNGNVCAPKTSKRVLRSSMKCL